MGISLGANQYGKAENRVVRVYRDTPRHELVDLNVSTSLRGDFADAHVSGDQADVLPTDTQKNTAFAFAKRHGVSSPEDYAIALGRRFLEAAPKADSAQIRVEQYPWDRIATGPNGHDHAFVRRGDGTRTTVVTVSDRGDAEHVSVVSGLRRPGRAEVDRLGVQGLPQGRVHDAAGGRRPHHGHLAGRPLALREHRRRLECAATTRSVRRCWRSSPRRTAARCRRRCT